MKANENMIFSALFTNFRETKIIFFMQCVLFSFFLLRNIKQTYSKYFQNKISKTDISSATQLPANSCSFAEILSTFSACNIS